MARRVIPLYLHETLLFLLLTCSSAGILIGMCPRRALAGAGGIGEGTPPCPAQFQCYGVCADGQGPIGNPDSFVEGPPMVTARALFAATALQLDKEIPGNSEHPNCTPALGAFRFGLVTGGIDAEGKVTSTAELFGPLKYGPNPGPIKRPTNLYQMGFDPTAAMMLPRVMHQATLFSSTFVEGDTGFSLKGQVLITGGSQNLAAGRRSTSALSSAEIFTFGAEWPASDPNAPPQGQFTAAGNMNVARTLHQATALPNGKVLITGGLNARRQALASAEIYDPSTGRFTFTRKPMKHARFAHTAILLSNGTVLITGGVSNGASYPNLIGKYAIKAAEIYNPVSNTFKTIQPMKVARAGHTASLITCPPTETCSGQVLVAGGITPSGVTASAEIYTAGGFSKVSDMTSPRFLHSAASIPDSKDPTTGEIETTGEILIAGGSSDAELGTTLDTAERFDPVTNTFVATNEAMGAPRRDFAAATPTRPIALSGFVILSGGQGSSGTSQATTDYYLPQLQAP